MRFDTPAGVLKVVRPEAGEERVSVLRLGGAGDASVLPERNTQTRSCSQKRKLKPPRGALRGGNRCISKDYLEKASAFDFGGRSS